MNNENVIPQEIKNNMLKVRNFTDQIIEGQQMYKDTKNTTAKVHAYIDRIIAERAIVSNEISAYFFSIGDDERGEMWAV